MDFDNIFYTYSVQKENDKFYVMVWDLKGDGHIICETSSLKVAESLEADFDNMAMDEEIELFKEIIKND